MKYVTDRCCVGTYPQYVNTIQAKSSILMVVRSTRMVLYYPEVLSSRFCIVLHRNSGHGFYDGGMVRDATVLC